MFINKASASKIKAYDSCKQKYKFRYIDRLRGTYNEGLNTDALQFGSYIHRIFELGVKAKTVEELEAIADSERPNYKFASKNDKRVGPMLKNFIRLNEQLTDTVGVELIFEVPMSEGYALNGIIDRVVKGKTGRYLVIDYKTSKRASTKQDLYQDVQMMMYAFAIHKLYEIPIEDVQVAHYYPHMDKLVTIKYLPSQLNIFMRKITNRIWEIRKRKKIEFLPTLNQFCNWCNFKELCPEFGGTPQKLEEAISSEGNAGPRK